MVARNVSAQELSYSRLLQVPDDDDSDFFTIQELKPSSVQQTLVHHYQPSYYELPNMLDNSCSSTTLQYQSSQPASVNSNSGNIMDTQQVDSPARSTRKRKASLTETSNVEEDTGEDSNSVKTNGENKKQNHSEIEKRRRDKMNTYITELSAMVPMYYPMSRKLDKLTVLRMAVQHIKTIRGGVNSYTEGHYKPSFLSDQELKHLILQAADGFVFVVGCDRGRILYVSESVTKVLNYSQGDLLGQSLFDILHPKDISKVKEQLSSSDLNPRERLIDAKTMLPVKTDVPQGVTKLCPGARRSFFCRMKCKMSVSQIKEEADTTTGCHRRKKHHQNPDKKYNVIHCTGYLKSWAPTKPGLEDQENENDVDSCNLSCLAAIGRILPPVLTASVATQGRPNVRPMQFISRHTLDGKFLYVDQKATLILGFLPQELLGTSMYEYYHHDDIHAIAECHKNVLQSSEKITTKVYRFLAKNREFVCFQTEWKSFKNPWTKEIEYLIAKNNLILTDYRTVESSASRQDGIHENFDFFTHSNGKDIQRMINTHIEARKIGGQIAEQHMDSQRRGGDSSGSSPDPDPESSITVISASGESHISTSITSDQRASLLQDYRPQPHTYNDGRNLQLTNVANDPVLGGHTEENIIEMMEETARESPSHGVSTDGNDEAAMAVIMSLLEADAGLGGPVDFSGLPWPLP